MISALLKAIGQLSDKRTRRILLWVILTSLAFAAGLIVIVSAILMNTTLLDIGFLDSLIDAVGGLAAAFIAWLLFPSVAVMIAYLFTDAVVAAVEARHYPNLPRAKPQSIWRYTGAAIRFETIAIILNILILPILLIPFVHVIYPFIFYAMNGFLFGREFMEIVAPRRMDFKETRALRRRHRGKTFVAGVIIALLFSIPVINLIAPVIATAFMTHVFHGLRASGEDRDVVPA